MERLEINIETGESKIVQLTSEEVAIAQTQYAAWQEEQNKQNTSVDLQARILALETELNAIKSKVGA